MNIYYSLFILSLTKSFWLCMSENLQTKSFSEPDLRVDFQQDGEIIQLKAFKSHENDLILQENNVRNYERLRWYSIGNPLLVKVKSNDSEYVFQFNRRGFYGRIEMLTTTHKQLFIAEVKRVYNITVKLNQIDHLILSSFNCEIPVHKGHNSNEEDIFIKGEVTSFTNFPLRIDFRAPVNSKDREWFNSSLSESEDNIQLKCDIKSEKDGLENKFSLYTDNLLVREIIQKPTICGIKISSFSRIFPFLLDESNFNCQYGGLCSCLNGGTCSSNGKCICNVGFDGSTCQTYMGCQAGESLSCLNNGKCLSNGICECSIGYSSSRCEDYKGCNNGGFWSCLNGGTCNSVDGTCTCLDGYVGSVCSSYVGCLANGSLSCQNEGICMSNGLCDCKYGFGGPTCSNYKGCNQKGYWSCLNGGTCNSNGTCVCTVGFDGSNCQSYIGCRANESLSCKNNGRCLPTGICDCSLGFSGSRCEDVKAIGCQTNESLSCLNNGTCLHNSVCECIFGYNGIRCENYLGCNAGGYLSCYGQAKYCLKDGSCGNFNSLILTPSEDQSLSKMVNKNVKSLLYRGSRDGFGASAFHSRCDGKSNTVTIILNDQNHVFGGYTSIAWHSVCEYRADSNAYLFSLRRGKSTNSEKYLIGTTAYAIAACSNEAARFGNDIIICSDANIKKCSTNNKNYYQTPNAGYLSGASDSNWLVTEIEVYQLE